MVQFERVPAAARRSDTERAVKHWNLHAAVVALVLVFVSGSWSPEVAAGANKWTWYGYPSSNPGCEGNNLNTIKDCWISAVNIDIQCPGAVGGVTSVTQDAADHWWADLWAQRTRSDLPNGVFDCDGPPSYVFHLYVDLTDVCPAPAELDIWVMGCTKKQRCDANGQLVKGNPCEVLSGSKRQREVDYAPGTGVLAFQRTYNSVDYHPAKLGSPLGSSWFASYLQYLAPETANGLSAAYVHAVRPNGDVIRFNSTNPGSTSTQFQAVGELKDRLVLALNTSGAFVGWRYITADDTEELYSTDGHLLTIRTRGGVTQTITYGANGKVSTVTDDFGHALTFQWEVSGLQRLTAITLPGAGAGQIAFTYGANNNLTQVTYPDTRTRRYSYLGGTTQANLLAGLQDEAAVVYASWTYGAKNVVTSSVHAGNVDNYTFTYNADGSRVIVDPRGTSRTYTSQLIAGQQRYTGASALCPGCGEFASATYDALGNFQSKVDFNGVQTTYAYDTVRTLETSRTEAYGTPRARTISTTWHANFRLPTLITEPGRTTAFTYDTAGNLLLKDVTDTATSAVRRTTWTYDTYGRVLTEDGPRTDMSDVTTYTYYTCTTGSECGQLNTVTNALNHVTTFTSYNAHGQPLSITDPNGVITTLTYDLRQRLTSRAVGGEQTTFEYWPTGLLKKVTLPDASFVQYTYDDAHRLTRIDDSLGNYILYTLDGSGNRTAENVYDPTNFLRRRHSRVFNSLNQLWKDLTAAGTVAQTTVFGYDSNGNQTTVNEPLTRNTTSVYDELSRITQITDPATGITQLGYDANDNVSSVTDPRSKVTSYTYNGFNDVLTQTSPDTGGTTNTYDSGGNLKTSTDARAAITTYSYDALNRVTSAAYKIGSTTDQTVSVTYDAGTHGKGRRTGASDAKHSMSWVYDALGRVTSKSQTVGTVTKTVGYGYTNGNLTLITTPSGQTVVYGYNANHQVTSITVNSTTLLSGATYDSFGPVKGWTWGNSTTSSRTFDTDGNVSQIVSAATKNYGYDDAFRITGITDTGTPANSYTYGYDSLDRLTSAMKTGSTSGWTYDANGNRLSETGASPSTYTISSTNNRISSISGSLARTYTYSTVGSALTYSNITATYNNHGRLKTLKKASTTATYVYNALDQLVKQSGGPSGTVHYVYDEAGHLLGEYNSTGALIQETIWLGDTPVATLRPGTPIGIFYVHTDHLNTPRRVTQPSGNQLRWTWEADPFGTATPNENPASLGTFKYNLRFPGQIYDSHGGLMQNHFRDYDPQTGRYVESDPIGLSGGTNTYAYTSNTPISDVDPLGLLGRGGQPTTPSATNGALRFGGGGTVKPLRGPFGPVCGAGVNAAWIPDGPWKSACANHDRCYDTCGGSRLKCDIQFLVDSWGNVAYFTAIRVEGRQAFVDAQKKCNGCNATGQAD